MKVALEWYPEHRKWDRSTPPELSQAICGVLSDGQVSLAQRALCFEGLVDGDVVLRVAVDGQEWYCNKAKYEEAELLGVERCTNGYCVDSLWLSEGHE